MMHTEAGTPFVPGTVACCQNNSLRIDGHNREDCDGDVGDNGQGTVCAGMLESKRSESVARTSNSILNQRRLTVQTQRPHYAHIPLEG